jgi:Transposase C of IS166 homeodomain
MSAAALPDLNALDADALRAMVVEQHAVIERLQTMIAHLRRMQFGRKSEKIERQVEQLELELEELECTKAAQLEALERKLEPAKAGSCCCGTEARSSPFTGPSSARSGNAHTRRARLPGMRRGVKQAGRRRSGSTRMGPSEFQGDPSRSSQDVLYQMRRDRAGGSAEPPNCARSGRPWSAGACARF